MYLYKHNKSAARAIKANSAQKTVTTPGVLVGCVLLAYLLRITIPAVWLNQLSPYVLSFSGYVMLAIALFYLLFKGARVDHLAILVLISIGLSVIFSDSQEIAFLKFLIWASVFMVAGPFLIGIKAYNFRDLLWQWHKYAVVLIAILSFIWYIFRLPVYGKGMSGVTMHCMILGPLAALSAVYAMTAAFFSRSIVYALIGAASIITCFASGSRAAALGGFAGVAVIPLLRIKAPRLRVFLISILLLGSLVIWNWFDLGSMDIATIVTSEHNYSDAVSELISKGVSNTREILWENRWSEFYANPFVGVGLGIDTFVFSETAYGTINVEPGSSYLSVLSMAGLAGALGILAMFLSLVIKSRSKWAFIPAETRTELIAAGIFWAIHAVAEGWIFAAGSVLCLFFWLWVGRLSNLGSLSLDRSTTT